VACPDAADWDPYDRFAVPPDAPVTGRVDEDFHLSGGARRTEATQDARRKQGDDIFSRDGHRSAERALEFTSDVKSG
jgi:hypothetical protein